MTNYDFRSLHDKEFELLCADLLAASLGTVVETFKSGRDQGIDGRFFPVSGGQGVLQCKHFVGSGFSKLFSKLQTDERPKIAVLSPVRYILATSLPLSAANKEQIKLALAPFVLRSDDVLGAEALNSILANHPELVRRHFKLWLSSIDVLNNFLNKAIYERSRFTLQEARDFSRKYVATHNESAALKRLDDQRVAIITGEPGVGKTTLAEQLCLRHQLNGFEVFRIGEDIREAEDAWDENVKQLFYFDDFLGSNYLQAISSHVGSHITYFLRRVSKSTNKRFLLTSRTTVLNRGKQLFDKFEHSNIARAEYELKVNSLSQTEKAHILYNHIWHSELPRDFIREIYHQQRYRKIIEHQNFNPRLISYITDFQRLGEQRPETYWSYALSLLDNPATVWQHPFENQMDETARPIVLLVTLHRGAIKEYELAKAFEKLISNPQFINCTGSREFAFLMKQLGGSLLNRCLDAKTGAVSYSHFNPSVGDFALHRYAKDAVALTCAIDSQRQKRCVSTLIDAARDQIVDGPTLSTVAERLILSAAESEFVDCTGDYVAEVARLVLVRHSSRLMSAHLKWAVFEAAKYALAYPSDNYVAAACELCAWLISEKLESAALGASLLESFEGQSCFDVDELKAMHALAFKMYGYTEVDFDARDLVREIAIASIQSSIEEDISGSDLLYAVDEADYKTATQTISGFIDERLSEVGLNFDWNARREILAALPVNALLDAHYRQNEGDPDGMIVVPQSTPLIDEIDELFRRDDL